MIRWARTNLFSTWWNTVLTVVFSAVAGAAVWRAARFVFASGRWEIIRDAVDAILIGRYPRDQVWRVWVLAFLLTATVAYFTRPGPGGIRANVQRLWPILIVVAAALVLRPTSLVAGAVLGLAGAALTGRGLRRRQDRWIGIALLVATAVSFVLLSAFGGTGWDRWGGLLLTLFLATVGIAASFPLGVLLALGRRSELGAVRAICIGYIELIRGVPLITLLFMASFVVGFLFPPGVQRPSLVTRAIIAIVAFTAAYVAEIVRGGLQSIPSGQVEAAKALGLGPIRVTGLIVLPQALRAVVPAMVGQFISLFKDTSLVAIIGLTELFRTAETLTAQPRYIGQGLQPEVLVVVSLLYWAGAYTMSRESRRLETA